ncbi:MAG: hypothetical protein AB7E72_02410 [Lysobacterales bacterium]
MKASNLLVSFSAALMALTAVPMFAQTTSAKEPGSINQSSSKSSGIVMLTTSRGFMAREILALGANQPTDDEVLASPASALAYAEVDSFDLSDYDAVEHIRFLASIGTPLLFESDTWNIAWLHEVVGTIFPGAQMQKLQNTGVIVRQVSGATVSVEDADFTPVQLMAGIAPEKTAEATNGWSSSLEKGTSPIHWTVRFAAKAYETSPTDSSWRLRYNNNVVDVWTQNSSPTNCLVAWRGSDSFGDWIRDIQSVTYKRIPGTPVGNNSGTGFVDRLANLDDLVRDALFDWNCNRVTVTGHSLGGAMSHIHTLQLMYDPDYDIAGMRAYNAARAFNSTAYTTYRGKLNLLQDGQGIYCRTGDPVNPVPAGLQKAGPSGSPDYGCTYWGARKSLINPIANHSLTHWSTEL